MFIVIALLCLLGLTALGLAGADVYSDVFTAEPNDAMPSEFLSGVITENYYYLTEESLNSYMAYLIQQNDVELKSNRVVLTGFYMDLKSETASKVYASVNNNGKEYIISTDCVVKLNGERIDAELSNVKVGKLPVPDGAVKKILNNAEFGSNITASDLTVSVPANYTYDVGVMSELVNIDIIGLTVKDDGVELSTNPVVNDALKALPGTIIDKLGDIFK